MRCLLLGTNGARAPEPRCEPVQVLGTCCAGIKGEEPKDEEFKHKQVAERKSEQGEMLASSISPTGCRRSESSLQTRSEEVQIAGLEASRQLNSLQLRRQPTTPLRASPSRLSPSYRRQVRCRSGVIMSSLLYHPNQSPRPPSPPS